MFHQFLFQPIHDLARIEIVSQIAWFFSYPITYLFIFFVVFWAIFYARRRMYSFAFIFLTGITSWFASNLIKVLVRTERPFIELGFNPQVMETGFSFPSNHTTVVTALALAVCFLNPKLGRFLLFIAVLVGISRVILGVHYPVDILGGFVLGYFVYFIYKKVFQRF